MATLAIVLMTGSALRYKYRRAFPFNSSLLSTISPQPTMGASALSTKPTMFGWAKRFSASPACSYDSVDLVLSVVSSNFFRSTVSLTALYFTGAHDPSLPCTAHSPNVFKWLGNYPFARLYTISDYRKLGCQLSPPASPLASQPALQPASPPASRPAAPIKWLGTVHPLMTHYFC